MAPANGKAGYEDELREYCILSEDKAPQGYILNNQARHEMERIAEAAHFQKHFKILQPTFFSVQNHDVTLAENILSTINSRTINPPSIPSYPSGLSVDSQFAQSQCSSGSPLGSFTSFDSNISQSSLPGTSSAR